MRVRNSLRDAVFRAPYLGTVFDLELADYVLGISVDALSESRAREDGRLPAACTTRAPGRSSYFTLAQLARHQLRSVSLFGEMQRQIIDLQQWTMERNR